MAFIAQAAHKHSVIGIRALRASVLSGFLSLVTLLLAGLSSPLQAQGGSAHFPVPDSIKPAIAFWTKVYTEVDTGHGYLHDSVNLSIIYDTLPRDSKVIEARRKEIQADLKVLASGKRQGLSQRQQAVLKLWGDKTSNARFAEAAETVRWQLGQSDRYLAGLVRSGAYRPYIDQVVHEMGLPPELATLPHVESSFHPGAQSSVAATGMWQFMRETAQRFMRVDAVVDDRLDPYTSTVAAMKMLKSNYDMLGSWPLALTGYNHGPNGVARAVRDAGTSDIGRIISEYKGPRFGFASRNFYPQFLAALEVDRNAERYFGKVARDPAPQFQTVELKAYMDAAVVAQALAIDLDTLKRYNPALLPQVWSGNKRIPKGFRLKIDSEAFAGNLDTGIGSIASIHFHPEQVPDVSYRVQRGDTLSGIATRFGTSVAELAAINQLRDRHAIRIGQNLVLPQKNGAVPTLVVNRSEPAAAVAARPATDRYVVQRGDTISVIAQRFGVPSATLLALNGLDQRGLIRPGQQLRLRAEGSAAALTAAAAPSPGNVGAELETSLALAQQQFEAPGVSLTTLAVADDGSIEILPEETIGHYNDWLKLDRTRLLQLNGKRDASTVRVGERLKLDFSKVEQAAFLQHRKAFHERLQESYFAAWRIRDTEQYRIRQSDLLLRLTQQRDVPLWLFRQYNPGIDVSMVRVGQVVVFPVVERITN